MENTKQIEEAVEIVKKKNLACIVRHYDGFIIIAQSEQDYQVKVNRINRGDIIGFYTIKRVLQL